VTIVLVDCHTGIVRAVRATSWSRQFAAAVRRAIRAQTTNASTEAQGAAEVERWYARYPTTEALVRAADLTTRGGQAGERT
jgi:hypothetical protein